MSLLDGLTPPCTGRPAEAGVYRVRMKPHAICATLLAIAALAIPSCLHDAQEPVE